MIEIPEPTDEQCTNNEVLTLPDGREARACWYPQIGGYSAKALFLEDVDHDVDHDVDPEGPDVYVMHRSAVAVLRTPTEDEADLADLADLTRKWSPS